MVIASGMGSADGDGAVVVDSHLGFVLHRCRFLGRDFTDGDLRRLGLGHFRWRAHQGDHRQRRGLRGG